MLRETSVAMISFKSTWVASDAGTAGVGSTASAAMAPSANADFIRPRNIVRRNGTVIAFTFLRTPRQRRYSPTSKAANSLLGRGRRHKRCFRDGTEIGQQGCKQP